MTPILYSFRRCPYAMRARLSLAASGQRCELREVVLRDKPAELIAASPKGTVPVLVLPDSSVIDESLDIMVWALGKNDPKQWLPPLGERRDAMLALIAECDGTFKQALDRYKYPQRFENVDALEQRHQGSQWLMTLDVRLSNAPFLFGNQATLADAAIMPFVRQFAQVDRAWFDAQPWPALLAWLQGWLESELFGTVMAKHEPWRGGPGISFP